MKTISLLKSVDSFLGGVLVRLWPARPRGPVPGDFSRVLVIRPGGIGDAILLAPALQALRKHLPHAVIDVLAERRNAGAFALVPEVDRLFRYDNPGEFWRVLRSRYNLVIDTEQWHRLSAIVGRLLRPRWLVGFDTNERRRLLDSAVPYSHEDYETESFLRLLEPLGFPAGCFAPPFLQVPEKAREAAESLLGETSGRRFVAIFPGASIPERRWGTDRFAEVARRLSGDNLLTVVIGGAEDREAGDRIASLSSGINLAGATSLAETAAVLERATLLIGGDSGVLHLAVGLDRPTVSLFGPGIARKWAPRGARHRVLNRLRPCSPCTRFGYTPKCSHGVECLADISESDVVAAVEVLLKGGP